MEQLACPMPGCFGSMEAHAYEGAVTDHTLECSLCLLHLGPHKMPEEAVEVYTILQTMKAAHAVLSRLRTSARLVLARQRPGEARAHVGELLLLANRALGEK